MNRRRVLIVCGGPDNEHEVSLRTGKNVFDNIDRELFDPQLCLINKHERWYTLEESNLPNIAEWPRAEFVPLTYDDSLSCFDTGNYDVVFNALHGKYGEGGRLQCILDQARVRYTGSGLTASAICMDKRLTNRIIQSSVRDVQVPAELAINTNLDWPILVDFLQKKVTGEKIVLKSATDGSSFNVFIVSKNDSAVPSLIRKILDLGETALVQEFIEGLEVTCPVLGSGDNLEALPVGQIEYPGEWFDYEAKYSGKAVETFPADSLDSQAQFALRLISEVVHKTLGCRGLTRSDFILSKSKKLYFLEINTSPGMTAQSLCPQSAYAHGWTYSELVTRIIESAYASK